MPIEVSWLYEKRVIRLYHYGLVTSEELVKSIADVSRMTEEGDSPVHTFLDSRGMEGKADIALGDLRKMIPRTNPRAGWTVAVQPRALDRFLSSLGMQISGTKYKFFPNEEDAMAFLLEHDPTLHDVIR
jgi:hypothetical protein